MKILQVIPTLGTGGAEHFVKELSLCLNDRENLCDVLTLYDNYENKYLFNELKDNGIQVFSLHKGNGFDLRTFIKLRSFIKNGEYDVVHSHVGAIKYTVIASLTYRKVKYVATIHSEAKREAGKSIDKWSRKLLFGKHLCTPITISDDSEKSFNFFYGYHATMIPNGLSIYKGDDLAAFKDNPEQILFIHPASCRAVKNQELLLSAFALLVKDFSNVKLLWLGSNKTYHNLYESLEKLFVDQVQYVGIVDNVRDYLAQADAMCLSSKMEGMPITIIESFSVGCIPLCTPVGGCVNMIQNGVNGILSEDLSVESYCKMLKSFCKLSTEERTRIKAVARKSFEKYTIEECANRYLQVYKAK